MGKHGFAALSLALVGLGIAGAAWAQDNEIYQEGWNRTSEHYEQVEKGHARRCQEACIADNRCFAWAYTKSGERCRLMSQSPPAPPQQDECCVTGIKQN